MSEWSYFVPLTRGYRALVDEQDVLFLLRFAEWCYNGGYAICHKGPYKQQTRIYMHRLVAERAGLDVSDLIDHKDRNKLDYRRVNLRPASPAQNTINSGNYSSNTSGTKGIDQHRGRWRARTGQVHIGSFDTREEAERARVAFIRNLYGEFAP